MRQPEIATTNQYLFSPVALLCSSVSDFWQGMPVQVACSGNEERLLDCVFPENFGDYVSPAERGPGAPSLGLAKAPCGLNDDNRLAVICRRFDIPGAASGARCAPPSSTCTHAIELTICTHGIHIL